MTQEPWASWSQPVSTSLHQYRSAPAISPPSAFPSWSQFCFLVISRFHQGTQYVDTGPFCSANQTIDWPESGRIFIELILKYLQAWHCTTPNFPCLAVHIKATYKPAHQGQGRAGLQQPQGQRSLRRPRPWQERALLRLRHVRSNRGQRWMRLVMEAQAFFSEGQHRHVQSTLPGCTHWHPHPSALVWPLAILLNRRNYQRCSDTGNWLQEVFHNHLWSKSS